MLRAVLHGTVLLGCYESLNKLGRVSVTVEL